MGGFSWYNLFYGVLFGVLFVLLLLGVLGVVGEWLCESLVDVLWFVGLLVGCVLVGFVVVGFVGMFGEVGLLYFCGVF